jgi:carbon monoxide dehydrogenase subunit G
MRFEREILVGVPPARAWAFLWDVERVARCLPGCTDVRTVAPHKQYAAVVNERVGPFRVRFPLDIRVLEVDEGRRLTAQAAGRDSAMGSSLKVALELRLEPAPEGSRLVIVTDTTILGKLGTLGQGVIQHKADGVMAQFAGAVRRELEADPGGAEDRAER